MLERRPRHAVAVAVASLLLASGCSDGGPGATAPTRSPATTPPSDTGGRTAGDPSLSIETVATGLSVPWGLAFTADGRRFVTERDTGRILEVAADGTTTQVLRLPVDPAGEGGLLGIAPSPRFPDDGWLYVYYTSSEDNRVVRVRLDGSSEPILTGIPAGRVHDGGRIAFGPDGMLYVGTGDAGEAGRAQDRESLGGKILRLRPDGSVPEDNPIDGSPVYSLGHRNVQGLAWAPDGTLYAAEFGPDRDDEINRIEPGANYGWPVVTGRTDDERFVDPVLVRQPPAASWSGMTLPQGSRVAAWDGDLVVASLRGRRLWHVRLGDDGTVQGADALLVDRFGRLRLATRAPDGSIWVTTSNRDGRGDPAPADDRILRLVAPEGRQR